MWQIQLTACAWRSIHCEVEVLKNENKNQDKNK